MRSDTQTMRLADGLEATATATSKTKKQMNTQGADMSFANMVHNAMPTSNRTPKNGLDQNDRSPERARTDVPQNSRRDDTPQLTREPKRVDAKSPTHKNTQKNDTQDGIGRQSVQAAAQNRQSSAEKASDRPTAEQMDVDTQKATYDTTPQLETTVEANIQTPIADTLNALANAATPQELSEAPNQDSQTARQASTPTAEQMVAQNAVEAAAAALIAQQAQPTPAAQIAIQMSAPQHSTTGTAQQDDANTAEIAPEHASFEAGEHTPMHQLIENEQYHGEKDGKSQHGNEQAETKSNLEQNIAQNAVQKQAAAQFLQHLQGFEKTNTPAVTDASAKIDVAGMTGMSPTLNVNEMPRSISNFGHNGTLAQQATFNADTQNRAAYTAHNVAIDALPFHMKRADEHGTDIMEIRLDPLELGKIEVRLQRGDDNSMTAHIIADQASTYALLKDDSAALEKSLRSLGMQMDSSNLQFSLRQDGQNGQKQGLPHIPFSHLNSGSALDDDAAMQLSLNTATAYNKIYNPNRVDLRL